MSIVFDISHVTEYRYAKPVGFGEHRLMFRPRDSHYFRVLATDLKVDPEAVGVRMIQDVYSNSIALVNMAREIRFWGPENVTRAVISIGMHPSA